MRIEIDKKLAKILDEIKQQEYSIYGRGHVETVRFLANYYRTHEPLQTLIEDLGRLFEAYLKTLNEQTEASIEKAFLKAMQQVAINVFATKDAKPPQERSPGLSQETEKRR